MQRFRHAPGIGLKAAGARRSDAHGVHKLITVEPKKNAGRHGAADRADRSRRMEKEFGGIELARREAQPRLRLDARGERCEERAARSSRPSAAPADLASRSTSASNGDSAGDNEWLAGIPHRLVVEHVHRCAVDPRRFCRRATAAMTDQACLGAAGILQRERGQQAGPGCAEPSAATEMPSTKRSCRLAGRRIQGLGRQRLQMCREVGGQAHSAALERLLAAARGW